MEWPRDGFGSSRRALAVPRGAACQCELVLSGLLGSNGTGPTVVVDVADPAVLDFPAHAPSTATATRRAITRSHLMGFLSVRFLEFAIAPR